MLARQKVPFLVPLMKPVGLVPWLVLRVIERARERELTEVPCRQSYVLVSLSASPLVQSGQGDPWYLRVVQGDVA